MDYDRGQENLSRREKKRSNRAKKNEENYKRKKLNRTQKDGEGATRLRGIKADIIRGGSQTKLSFLHFVTSM